VSKPVFEVAVALVYRDGHWLVARRKPGVHLGGLWEFPGGKRETGETPSQAAIRELREECAVDAVAERELAGLTHEYEERVVHLLPVICRWRAGEGLSLGNQECRWVAIAELASLEMPAINAEILRELHAALSAR
jgi:8-oxo-dGTP diphosphatase